MEDPASTVHDRPYRYLLDSESEDEYPDSGPSTSRLSKIQITQPLDVSISGAEDSYDEVILGAGQAGKYLVRKLGVQGNAQVKVAGEVIGSGGVVDGRLVLGVNEDIGDLHSLAKGLLDKVRAGSW